MRYGRPLAALTPAQRNAILKEAAQRVGYQGALESGGDIAADDLKPDPDAIAHLRQRGWR